MLSVKNLLLLVGLVYLVKTASSCSCLPGHPQQAYCSGALTFSFKVFRKTTVNVTITPEPFDGGSDGLIQIPTSYTREMIRYDITRFRLYQGNEQLKYPSYIRSIYTSISSASCGVNLSLFKKYVVIGGYYADGRLEIGLCNHIFDRSSMNFIEQYVLAKNILYGYKEGCKCTVKNCIFEACVDPRPGNECYTSDLSGLNIPYSQTTCKPYKNGCLWNDGFHIIPPKPQVSTTPYVLIPKTEPEK